VRRPEVLSEMGWDEGEERSGERRRDGQTDGGGGFNEFSLVHS